MSGSKDKESTSSLTKPLKHKQAINPCIKMYFAYRVSLSLLDIGIKSLHRILCAGQIDAPFYESVLYKKGGETKP